MAEQSSLTRGNVITGIDPLSARVFSESQAPAGEYLLPVAEPPCIAGFEVHEEIARGPMSVVYRATQLSLNRTVALKLLPESLAARPLLVERIEEETKALSALNHPNVVTIIDGGRVDETWYFAMEYVEGETLRERMVQAISAREVLMVGRAVAMALHYAHARGIVHRDIKPSNIMLTPDGLVKVMDFGLAGLMAGRVGGPGPEASRTRMGTPGYMSPEQSQDATAVDGRADIFSTGAVLYELICRRMPRLPAPERPGDISPEADPRLDGIVLRCLEAAPRDRYQCAGELLRDIDALRREMAKAPRCPSCRHVSPVRFERCGKCSRDLSEQFDVCADCGASNRLDVRRCLCCGADLRGRRSALVKEIERKFTQVNGLRLRGDYDRAEAVLGSIADTKGKLHQRARFMAQEGLEQIREERRQLVQSKTAEGKRLFNAGDVNGALNVWKGIQPRSPALALLIQRARARRRELAIVEQANNKTNGVLIVAAVLLLITVVVVSLAAA